MRYDGIFLQNLRTAGAVADPLFGGSTGDGGRGRGKIVFGRMPDFLLEAGQKGYGTWTNGFVSAWFRIRDGTQVYVEGGSRITVELSEEPQLLVITSLLLSAGMALVCLQRGEPFFHGSALYTGEQAILLCGESGAGKSTVAMEFVAKKCLGFLRMTQ